MVLVFNNIIDIKMSKQSSSIPICYQITVSNITTIGNKVMSDFYVIFKNQTKNNSWQSPTVHGKLTKQNNKFPWTFVIDNPKLTVNFCEVDQQSGTDKIVGSTPLLLLKKQGEEQFLIFGSQETNRGRKVAEVQFQYYQCSLARSSEGGNKTGRKNQQQANQSDSNRRVSLEYSNDITVQKDHNENNQPNLNIIPEEQQIDNMRQSMLHKNTIEEQNFDDDRIEPSKLQTLRVYSDANQLEENGSQGEYEMLRDMEDTADKWYRSNFGKNKPINIQNYDFSTDSSRVHNVVYDKQFDFLNNTTFMKPHMEIKNIVINSHKKPRIIELYCLDFSNGDVNKSRVAKVELAEGYKREWNNTIRLPTDKKAFGLEIITEEKERLQGLIIRDQNSSKNKVEIFNQQGEPVGNAVFAMKLMKKIQIQTLQMVNEDHQNSQISSINRLNQSFVKSMDRSKNKKSKVSNQSNALLLQDDQQLINYGPNELLKKQKYLKRDQIHQTSNSQNSQIGKIKTIRNLHQEEQPLPREIYNKKDTIIKLKGFEMNNLAYINRPVNTIKTNLRRHQYEPLTPKDSTEPNQIKNQASINKQSKIQKKPQPQKRIVKSPQSSEAKKIGTITKSRKMSPPLEIPTISKKNSQKSIKKSKSRQKSTRQKPSLQIKEEVLNQKQKAEPKHKKSSSNRQLLKKIEQIKKITNKIQKYWRPNQQSPINHFRTTQDYDYNNSESATRKVSFPNRNSSQQKSKVNFKKTYRQPISFTPFFSSLSSNHFERQIKKNDIKKDLVVDEQSPLKMPFKNNVQSHFINADRLSRSKKSLSNKKQKANIQQLKNNTQTIDIPEKQGQQPQLQKQRKNSMQMEYGVNTQRMSIVNNILQSSYVPEIFTTQKRKGRVQAQSSKRQQSQFLKQQQNGSVVDSLLNQHTNHKTKYSSQTIQPITSLQRINFFIITISIHYYENLFGVKFVKAFIPNKYCYRTQTIKNSNSLMWKCKGFVFNNIQHQQDLYIQLFNQAQQNGELIGRCVIAGSQFKNVKQQAIIRAYLTRQGEIIGEVLLTYQNALKNNQLKQELPYRRNHTTQDYKTIQKQSSLQKETTPIKMQKRRKKKKRSDSVTEFLKNKRKDKINRYIVNQYSRANIESRINPIRQKKYEAGKKIVFGRNIRFPFSEEEEHFVNVPGPGAYRVGSQFQRYNH